MDLEKAMFDSRRFKKMGWSEIYRVEIKTYMFRIQYEMEWDCNLFSVKSHW